jgi:protein-S-isoprenylcysteine O-methyltransferase Ste14
MRTPISPCRASEDHRFMTLDPTPQVFNDGLAIQRLERIQVVRRWTLWGLVSLTFVAMLFVQSTWNVAGPVHGDIELFGLFMIVLAILGRGWCSLYLGGNKNRSLIVSGPYSICRNPLYIFSLIATFGMGAQSGSLLVSAGLTALVFVVFQYVVRREEGLLRLTFGDEFKQYCLRTPRFLPKPSRWNNALTLTVNLPQVQKTVVEAVTFFVALPLFETIEALQVHHVLPVLLKLP